MTDPSTAIMTFRLRTSERDEVDRAAAAAGLSRAEWLRQVVLAAAGSRALRGPLDAAARRGSRLAESPAPDGPDVAT